MAYEWQLWLLEALESDPYIAQRLVVVDGWETRGRPPSDFNFTPSGVLDHHTACMMRHGHDPEACLSVILNGNSEAPGPISQILGTWTPLGTKWNGNNVDPRVILVAAGRANHAGDAEYPWGGADDNAGSIGIEWCGPPESGGWPDEVVELRRRVSAVLSAHWGGSDYVTTHWEAAIPRGRKVDPSGSWYAEGNGANDPWDPDLWRREVGKIDSPEPGPGPGPQPPGDDDEMPRPDVVQINSEWDGLVVGSVCIADPFHQTYRHVTDEDELNQLRMTFDRRGWDPIDPIPSIPGWWLKQYGKRLE